jgi:hypothetical protein
LWAEKIYTKQGVVKKWDIDKGKDTHISNEKRKEIILKNNNNKCIFIAT